MTSTIPKTNLTPGPWEIRLPMSSSQLDQDAEYCSVLMDGVWQDIRFHDYAEIYRIPGLYEQLFHQILQCHSPEIIGNLLGKELAEQGRAASELRALDLGAGNGLVGQQLRDLGAGGLVGVDIIPEARLAALRDRPEVYDSYHIVDMINPPAKIHQELHAFGFNALTCVAALGYADIPPAAFRTAFNLVSNGGSVAFNIKDRFLSEDDTSGFAALIRRLRDERVLEIRVSDRYPHRRNVGGEPLHYVALVGTKHADIPADFLD